MAAFQVIQLNPKKFQASQIKFLIILLPICAVMILPIIYIICQAFKPLDELFYFPPRIARMDTNGLIAHRSQLTAQSSPLKAHTSWKNGKNSVIFLGKTAETLYFCLRKMLFT